MFTDSVTITFAAGKGGNGVVAWRREKFLPKGGPAGGDGGNGGSIIFQADVQVLSLQDYRNTRLIKAQDGDQGAGSNKQGHGGKDLLLKVPCGTLVKDAKTQEILHDFTEDKQTWIACKGGKGGRGNSTFKSPTNQAPTQCTPGTLGERFELELELKLIADVGLIGMPNAGKSTLMTQITHVPVKIGAYPFTTLFPNLSYVQFEDFARLLIADIPGIIENAHDNRGLGIAFLKHIERTAALVFVIDISGIEGRDPIEDFQVLRNELKAYRPELLEKPFLVALNKCDTEESLEHIERFRAAYTFSPDSLFEISAINAEGLTPLIEAMRGLVLSTPQPSIFK